MHWVFNHPPSRFFESAKMVPFWFPVIMDVSGSGRPPPTPAVLLLMLTGSIFAGSCEKQHDSQKLSMQEFKPFVKKEGEFSHSRAAMVRLQSPWLFRHN